MTHTLHTYTQGTTVSENELGERNGMTTTRQNVQQEEVQCSQRYTHFATHNKQASNSENLQIIILPLRELSMALHNISKQRKIKGATCPASFANFHACPCPAYLKSIRRRFSICRSFSSFPKRLVGNFINIYRISVK